LLLIAGFVGGLRLDSRNAQSKREQGGADAECKWLTLKYFFHQNFPCI
jgi:hypothetical protein